ncbi:hypothetical protein D3C86_2053530 [compost metagenome]
MVVARIGLVVDPWWRRADFDIHRRAVIAATGDDGAADHGPDHRTGNHGIAIGAPCRCLACQCQAGYKHRK